jgi:hypothetical protein
MMSPGQVVQGALAICATLVFAATAIASRDSEWWHNHWLGVILRALLSIALLCTSFGMAAAVDRGVTHAWSDSARGLWVFGMLAAMLHGGYGVFELLFETEDDFEGASVMRARLNLSLVVMGFVVGGSWWSDHGGPAAWRPIVAVGGVVGAAWGYGPREIR